MKALPKLAADCNRTYLIIEVAIQAQDVAMPKVCLNLDLPADLVLQSFSVELCLEENLWWISARSVLRSYPLQPVFWRNREVSLKSKHSTELHVAEFKVQHRELAVYSSLIQDCKISIVGE